MKDAQQPEHKIHKAKPRRHRANPNQEVATTMPTLAPSESSPQSPQGDCPDPLGAPASPPAAPLAFTIPAAWRRLCRKTGCTMTLRCFYKWVLKGRVDSVRMGAKIFIRAEVLDRLVDRAFQGESW